MFHCLCTGQQFPIWLLKFFMTTALILHLSLVQIFYVAYIIDSSLCESIGDKPDRADHKGSKRTEPTYAFGNSVTYPTVTVAAAFISMWCIIILILVANQSNRGADHEGLKLAAFSVGSSVSSGDQMHIGIRECLF